MSVVYCSVQFFSVYTGGDNDSLDSFALQENVATVDDDYIDYFSSSLANQDVSMLQYIYLHVYVYIYIFDYYFAYWL